jgi:hypothetical protein
MRSCTARKVVAPGQGSTGTSTGLSSAAASHDIAKLRLAYLGLTNTFAMLRLLPKSDRDKDIEILALRHQIGVLQRQLGDTRARVTQLTGRCSPHSHTDYYARRSRPPRRPSAATQIPHLEPATPAPHTSRIRALLQLPQAPPRHHQRPTATTSCRRSPGRPRSPRLNIRRRQRLGGTLNEYHHAAAGWTTAPRTAVAVPVWSSAGRATTSAVAAGRRSRMMARSTGACSSTSAMIPDSTPSRSTLPQDGTVDERVPAGRGAHAVHPGHSQRHQLARNLESAPDQDPT